MNRIVLIGNGFDLAHGLETRYSDFLFNYLKKHLISAENDIGRLTGDELIKFKMPSRIQFVNHKSFSETLTDLNTILINDHISWPVSRSVHSTSGSTSKPKNVIVEIKSEFFKKILKDENWTDIEKTYFDTIIDLYDNWEARGFKNRDEFNKKIAELNHDFALLKKELIAYITEINDKEVRTINSSFGLKLESVIDKCLEKPSLKYLTSHFSKKLFTDEGRRELNNIHFVNFNYTALLEKYISRNWDNVFHMHIHGYVVEPENVIFGYGDDNNPHYQKLEDVNIDSLLENIKSFYYPDKKNYIPLMNQLDLEEYDVIVIGHSLGLSDRVLLKSIFEHENCKAIRLIHRRGDKKSQFRKRIALSRHFENKQAMRRKIVDYDEHDVIY